MATNKPTSDQIRFRSRNSGEHSLDTYLEATEKGGRSLPDLMDDLFGDEGTFKFDVEFRFNLNTQTMEYRNGSQLDPEAGWKPIDDLSFFPHRGDYTPGTVYGYYDIVVHNNSVLYCTEPHTGEDPINLTKFSYLFDSAYTEGAVVQIAADKASVELTKANIESVASTIASQQTDITTRHTDIINRNDDIITRQADITTRHDNIVERHNAITTLANTASTMLSDADAMAVQANLTYSQATIAASNFSTTANEREADIQTEGNTQVGRVTAEGDTQVGRVQTTADAYLATLSGTLSELGHIDLSSNSYPTKPASSAIWFVQTGGTVDGKAFKPGDALFYSLENDQFYRAGTGEDGANGKSAYQVWIDQGNSGTEADFLNAIKGAQGIQGDQGPKGDQGNPGADGAAGANGQGVPTGGTTGQMLSKVDDTDFNSQWVDPPAGGVELIGSLEVTNSNEIILPVTFESTYKMYDVKLINLKIDSGSNSQIEYYASGSSGYFTGIYDYSLTLISYTVNSNYNTYDKMKFASNALNPSGSLCGEMKIFNPSDAQHTRILTHTVHIDNSGSTEVTTAHASVRKNEAIFNIKIKSSHKNFISGTILVYGLK